MNSDMTDKFIHTLNPVDNILDYRETMVEMQPTSFYIEMDNYQLSWMTKDANVSSVDNTQTVS